MLLPGEVAFPMKTSFASTGVVTLIELSTMHMGSVHPAQLPVPTVFALVTPMLQAKYSVAATRSCSADGGTASAILSRRCEFVSEGSMLPPDPTPLMPLVSYAPM